MFRAIFSSKACVKPASCLTTKLNLFFGHTALTKIVNNLEEATAGLQSGHKILVGGFGLGGIPENLIRSLAKRTDLKDLTLVTCTAGIPYFFNFLTLLFRSYPNTWIWCFDY